MNANFHKDKTPILMPANNEAKNLRRNLPIIKQSIGDQANIIVISNGSTDDTIAVAKKCGVMVFDSPAQGKLAALQFGWKYLEQQLGREQLLKTPVLHLDADRVPKNPDKWLKVMTGALQNLDHPRVVTGSQTLVNPNTRRPLIIHNAAWRIAMFGARLSGAMIPYDGGNQAFLMANDAAYDNFMNMQPNIWPDEDGAVCAEIANNYTGGDRLYLAGQDSRVISPYATKVGLWMFFPNRKRMRQIYNKRLSHPGDFISGMKYLHDRLTDDPNFKPYGMDNMLNFYKNYKYED